MTTTAPPAEWLTVGTDLFLRTLDRVPDSAFPEPSLLPGWSVAHLVAHVHHNALALLRLTSWAATGVECRMYESPEQRKEEIEAGAQLPPPTLRTLVTTSAAELDTALHRLSPAQWSATVVTAQGRSVPASTIPWLRTREVCVHTVDLGTSVGFEILPEDLLRALLDDILDKRLGRGEGPVLAGWLSGRLPVTDDLPPWL